MSTLDSWAARWVAVLLAVLAGTGLAEGLFDDGGGDEISLEEPGKQVKDFALLRQSHVSEVERWQGVRPLPARGKPAATGDFAWEMVEESGYNHLKSFAARARWTARPLTAAPIVSVVDVPEAGSYRVWLGYLARPGQAHPITLRLGDQELRFNEKGLSTSVTGAQVEKERPVRLETEMARVGMLRQPLFVWEYRDLTLTAGRSQLSLQAAPGDLRVDALVITLSKDFVPSDAVQVEANTLSKTFYRFRVAAGAGGDPIVFRDNLTYHRGHAVQGNKEPIWYWHMEAEIDGNALIGDDEGKPLAVGAWSRWVNASGASLNGGPTATAVLHANGMTGPGAIEVQLAWFPHEGAVLKTLSLPVTESGSRGLFMMPLYISRPPTPSWDGQAADPDEEPVDERAVGPSPVWGVRSAAWLARMRNALQVAEEHQAVVDALALPKTPPTNRLRMTTGARPDPAAMRSTAAMLRSMGFAHVSGPSKALLGELGMRQEIGTASSDILFHSRSHCPSDPRTRGMLASHFARTAANVAQGGWAPEDVTTVKLGDEIGAIVSAGHINGCSDCRARFHAYLEANYGGAAAFGETSLAGLDLTLGGSPAGVAERRLHYASQRFIFDFTAEFYRLVTEEIGKLLPNARTYCNFSPHPVIFGGTMNGSDWFNLTRRGGTTLAWGEDWASMSSWGFWMGMQVVSYYAALVEAGAKATGGEAGFYAVHGGANQQFSCIAKGVKTVLVYSYGPEYGLADGANAWSERFSRYGSIASGLRALGAADAILADGQREPARVGLLYNRNHEIWHADSGRLMQVERIGTMLALEQANCPAEIVLEEDLVGPAITHGAIYVQGFNLSDELVAALRRYVEAGGVLVASAGSGRYDRFDSRQPAARELLGVEWGPPALAAGGQAPDQLEQAALLDTIAFAPDANYPGKWPVVGMKAAMTPLGDTEVLGRFGDGSPAVVQRRLGQGSVTVWGCLPGASLRARSPRLNPAGQGFYNQYALADARLIAGPALAACGERGIGYAHHLVELRRFDLDGRTAVTMNNFYYHPLPEADLRLRIPAERPVTRVHGALAGDLAFTRDGKWLTARVAIPGEVEVVIVE